MKKRILALAPIMPQKSDIGRIASTLSFLDADYQIDVIDPLSRGDELAKDAFYHQWKIELKKNLAYYDAFFGFSFGGMILQQCFTLFEEVKKPIVLFSVPSFANHNLKEKLNKVIELSKKNQVLEALKYLYSTVFYPNKPPQASYVIDNQDLAARRLVFGLQHALDTDARQMLEQSTVDHLHLIGELSKLVNSDNVVAPAKGLLLVVPGAGMRILEDNQRYCEEMILQRLNDGY